MGGGIYIKIHSLSYRDLWRCNNLGKKRGVLLHVATEVELVEPVVIGFFSDRYLAITRTRLTNKPWEHLCNTLNK